MRQIVLDTETTGLEPDVGHRIIEIGALEMVERRLTGRQFHEYLNPERTVEGGALEVHGINNEFLADKPRFADIANAFLEFIEDSELIIHNAAFDVGFLDAELARLDEPRRISQLATVLDTLELARDLHPGQRNSLDALCRRYEIDNSNRTLHGALLDAELLAEVYLLMTGGQVALGLDLAQPGARSATMAGREFDSSRLVFRPPDAGELAEHRRLLERIARAAGEAGCLWLEQEKEKEKEKEVS